MVQKNLLATILINNFNNNRFINKCVLSCISQSYKNIEIIIYDDFSNDGSEKYLKKIKHKNIKKIFNKKKLSKSGPINQFEAIEKAFLKSKGEFIFLLDSDDFFLKDKVRYFVNLFRKNKNLEFIQDNPIYFYPIQNTKRKKLIKNKKFVMHTWPYFNPTSTMVFKRKFFSKLIKEIYFSKRKYKKMYFDARAMIYIYFFCKNFKTSEKYLTVYTQNIQGDTIKNYKNMNIGWWERRLEYHKFVEMLFYKKNKIHIKLIDYYFTHFLNWVRKNLKF
jgi:glycosyltransferase involved in cell wall biosynthesis